MHLSSKLLNGSHEKAYESILKTLRETSRNAQIKNTGILQTQVRGKLLLGKFLGTKLWLVSVPPGPMS